jgi:hypothetical protein
MPALKPPRKRRRKAQAFQIAISNLLL